MVQHYQFPEEKTQSQCIRCISEILVDFSMNLPFVFRLRPEAKSSVCLHKSEPQSVLERQGRRKYTLFELGAVQTQCMGHCVRQRRERMTHSHCKHSQLPQNEVYVCVCVCMCMVLCACARPKLRSGTNTGHTLSQCSLFSFHRYVNSNAKACIWCILKVYRKGEGR